MTTNSSTPVNQPHPSVYNIPNPQLSSLNPGAQVFAPHLMPNGISNFIAGSVGGPAVSINLVSISQSFRADMVRKILPSGSRIVAVGSRVTCDPPPTDTDEDHLILCADFSVTVSGLISLGFESDDETKYHIGSIGRFQSLRLGDVNYIVTDSPRIFDRFLTATVLAKRFNLTSKEDRIALFQAVRGGSLASEMISYWNPEWAKFVSMADMSICAPDGSIHLEKNRDTTGI